MFGNTTKCCDAIKHFWPGVNCRPSLASFSQKPLGSSHNLLPLQGCYASQNILQRRLQGRTCWWFLPTVVDRKGSWDPPLIPPYPFFLSPYIWSFVLPLWKVPSSQQRGWSSAQLHPQRCWSTKRWKQRYARWLAKGGHNPEAQHGSTAQNKIGH